MAWQSTFCRVFFSKGPTQKSSKYGIGPSEQDKIWSGRDNGGICSKVITQSFLFIFSNEMFITELSRFILINQVACPYMGKRQHNSPDFSPADYWFHGYLKVASIEYQLSYRVSLFRPRFITQCLTPLTSSSVKLNIWLMTLTTTSRAWSEELWGRWKTRLKPALLWEVEFLREGSFEWPVSHVCSRINNEKIV